MPQIQAAAPSCLGGCPTRTAASSLAILSSAAQLQHTARPGWWPGEEAGAANSWRSAALGRSREGWASSATTALQEGLETPVHTLESTSREKVSPGLPEHTQIPRLNVTRESPHQNEC